MNTRPRSSGVQLHPTSLPGGPPRARRPTRSSTGWRPRASRGGRCCRSGRRTATARRTRRTSAFAAWPGLLAEPRAPVSEGRGARLPRAQRRTGSSDWVAFGRRGAVADQVRFDREWAALRALRADARRAADRRRPDLRRARLRRPPRAPRAVPRRRRRRHAARRVHRQGPAVGQPALRLAGAAARAATAGGSSACGARSTSTTSRGSTTSAASSPTGRCRAARATRSSGRWRRGPGRGAVRRRGGASSASCR